MNASHVAWLAAALIGAVLPVQAGEAPGNPMPSEQMLARAASYVPPKLAELAAKLAVQPDMTGIWAFVQAPDACRGPLFDPANSTCPSRALDGESTFGPLPGTRVTSIPYNAEYQAIYDRHVAESLEGKARDTFATCIPYGVPRMVGESPTPFDIIQAPEVMIWYNDYARSERRIFLDGRAHPKGEDVRTAGPSYSGHSTGRWEGNTLVVETVDMINAYFDETSAPHSDKLTMTERIRLIDKDLIENEMTLVDQEAFTRPWVVKRYYRRQGPAPGQPMRRYLDLNDRPCVPNVRLDEEGFQVMMLPQEIEEAEARASGRPVQ